MVMMDACRLIDHGHIAFRVSGNDAGRRVFVGGEAARCGAEILPPCGQRDRTIEGPASGWQPSSRNGLLWIDREGPLASHVFPGSPRCFVPL